MGDGLYPVLERRARAGRRDRHRAFGARRGAGAPPRASTSSRPTSGASRSRTRRSTSSCRTRRSTTSGHASEIRDALAGAASRAATREAELVLTLDNRAIPRSRCATRFRSRGSAGWARRVSVSARRWDRRASGARWARPASRSSTSPRCSIAPARSPCAARATLERPGGTRGRASGSCGGWARWEWLATLPTRFLTGHYVGVLARKP